MEISSLLGSVPLAAMARGNLATVLRRLGRVHEAITLLELALPDKPLAHQGWCRNTLASCLLSQGATREAAHHLEASLRVSTELGIIPQQAIAHAEPGDVARHEGRYEDAAQHYERAFPLYEVSGQTHLQVISLCEYGMVLHHLGRSEAANVVLAKATELMEDQYCGPHAEGQLGVLKELLSNTPQIG